MSTSNAAQLAPLDDFNPGLYGEDARNREAVRYLFFPGDVIDPARKEELRAGEEGEIQIYAGGGDEIGSRCLVRTKGYLRKCRLTPLERWIELLPRELMPEGATPVGMTLTSAEKGSEQGITSFSPNLYGYPKYPGEEIRWITHSAHANGRKGIVELTELFDVEWDDLDRSRIQWMFFPEFPRVPATLREVEDLIRAHKPAEVPVGRKVVRTARIQNEMLTACAQFKRWATTRVEAENLLLKTGTTKDGWTYTYSGLAEVLLPQLEMARADEYMHDQAKFQKKLGENQESLIQALLEGRDNGADKEELILEMQRQFDERMAAMMRQNQEFMTTLLGGLFRDDGDDEEDEAGSAETQNPASLPPRPKKGKK